MQDWQRLILRIVLTPREKRCWSPTARTGCASSEAGGLLTAKEKFCLAGG